MVSGWVSLETSKRCVNQPLLSFNELFCFSLAFGGYSDFSCAVSRWFGLTTLLAAAGEHSLLSLDRFVLIKTGPWYQENLMFNIKYPLIATTINYILCALVPILVLFQVNYNENTESCLFDSPGITMGSTAQVFLIGLLARSAIAILNVYNMRRMK